MRFTNYVRGLLTAVLMLYSSFSMAAVMGYSFKVANDDGVTIYYYIESSTECSVTKEHSSSKSTYSGNVVIPESVTYDDVTYTVVAIEEHVFSDATSLKSVTLPNSITEIGEYAFDGCTGLTEVNIPNGVTIINEYTFRGCTSLTEVTIPESVTEIGQDAFRDCTGLTGISIPNSVETIGGSAFKGCTGLTGDLTIPESVTWISSRAFQGCTGLTEVNFNATACTTAGSSSGSVFSGCSKLSTVNFGENVTIIPGYLCYGLSGMTEVTIPEGITTIGSNTFQGCTGLSEVNFNATACTSAGYNGYGGSYAFYGCTNIATINFGENVTMLPAYLCYGLTSLTEVTIPNSVTTIGSQAFYGCAGLTEVTIGNSVTSIGNYAFYQCTGLTSLTIGNSVTEISLYAFLGCTGLTSVAIPESVTTIGFGAFWNCTGLTEVTIPNSVTEIGGWAFYCCKGLTKVNFNAIACTTPDASSYSSPFSGCPNLSTVNIGESVTIIPDCLCCELTELTEITIPNSVTEIGSEAFSGCTGLTEVTIPNSVTTIGDNAFGNCTKLSVVNLNATACTSAGSSSSSSSFSGCSWLSTLNIGENVTIIPAYLCNGLTRLTEVTIPNSVETIGNYAFYNCTWLSKVNFNAVACASAGSSSSSSPFSGCSRLSSLNIGENVTIIPAYLCYGLTGLKQVTVPNSVIEIGSSAFYNCTKLTEVIIGNSVTSIGGSAFYQCTGLTEVTIGNSVTEIGSSAFYNCTGLAEIYSQNETPPTIYSNTFYNVPKSSCILYVPLGCYSTYSKTLYWRDFSNIKAIDMSPLTVVTYEATEITPTSATLNGRAVASYNEGITEQGFEYWTADAEEADTITAEGENMSVTITDLTENTTYSYRAYVITEFDATRYGETLTFTTLYGSLHDTVTSETEEVRDSLGNVWSVIMTDYADVADGFGEEYEALSDELERLVQGLDDAYNDGTLTEEYAEEVRQRLEEISTETGKMLDEAKEAESSYLYSTITGRIKEAESTLGETWNTILTDCPHVAEGYEDTRDAISDRLEELLQDVEETYKEGELTKEATEEIESALETIAQETEDMLAVAKRAESDYLYAVVDDIKEVESLLSDTWETIKTDYAVVADDLTDTRDTLASELDELMQSVNEKYKNGGLTIEKVKAIESSLEAIRQEIDALPASAETARDGYLQALLDEIREAESALDNAWSELTTECTDVASDFKGDSEALAAEIGELLQGAEEAYGNKTFGDEMIEEVRQSLAAIEQEIEEMLTSAKRAESEYLYSIVDDIKEVEVLLSDIWETMEEECANVVDGFKRIHDAIIAELAELTQSMEEAHNQGRLTRTVATGITSSLKAIRQEIDDMLANAKAAENEYIYAMMDDIGEVEDLLDSAWKTIETECADVMYNYKDDYDAIASELEELRQIVEDTYKQGNLVTSMAEMIANSLEAIKQEIEDMLTTAKTAESNYQYSIIYEIEEVEDLLSEAWATITKDLADVADDYKDTRESLASELGSLCQSTEDAYTTGTLTRKKAQEVRQSLEEIRQAIEDMLTAAKVAQEALGIDGIISDYGDDVWIYDLSGHWVLAPERGNVYIFRYMDGTVKKMLVK